MQRGRVAPSEHVTGDRLAERYRSPIARVVELADTGGLNPPST